MWSVSGCGAEEMASEWRELAARLLLACVRCRTGRGPLPGAECIDASFKAVERNPSQNSQVDGKLWKMMKCELVLRYASMMDRMEIDGKL